jgi:predicted metalloprotease
MKLTGRRTSGNVEDRRGMSGGAKGAMGVGGIVIVALIVLLKGGSLSDVFNAVTQESNVAQTTQTTQSYQPTAEEQEMATFASQILASTEDVWTEYFSQMGLTYRPPKMVLFSGSTQSGCGTASQQTGPFYCSADQTVYLDLDFFNEMKQKYGGGGDFAYAYVIAHEVGHHVQYLLGTLDKVHNKMAQVSEKEANQLSVRLELQADFFAGLWANHENQKYASLEDGDIEEGMNAATAIGDDRLQMQAQGYTVPDAFNHGTSKQRTSWLKRGLTTGDINQGDTFSPSYANL